jgi:KUP system potassium uptake protein
MVDNPEPGDAEPLAAPDPPSAPPDEGERRRLLVLSVATLGVVFGDIGTSPIYAFRESFHPSHGLAPTAANVLGVLSLIFWSLIIVISVKYLIFVLRADNDGEGGIMALKALVLPTKKPSAERRMLVLAGLFGAALLYGDGMITPSKCLPFALWMFITCKPFGSSSPSRI